MSSLFHVCTAASGGGDGAMTKHSPTCENCVWSTNRRYYAESRNAFITQCKDLSDVRFLAGSYDAMTYPSDCVIYCDPPYTGTKPYKDSFDSAKFWTWAEQMSKTRLVYVSEYSAPEHWTCVWQKPVVSSLGANGKQGQSKVSVERLFTMKR